MRYKPLLQKYIFAFPILFFSLVHAQFYSLETKNVKLLYYSKGHEFVVPYLAQCFENAYRFHCQMFDYQSPEKISLLLQDFGDFASGAAGTVPRNHITIGISPFSYTYETMTANERMHLMMNHELTHIVTMDKATGKDDLFRSLFSGKVYPKADAPISILYFYLTSPRWNSPRWYHEGIAVFMETWMAGGMGRALGAYDEMLFRTMVRDSSYFYDVVGLEAEGTQVDFQVGAKSYLYGTRFISYLAYQYGPEKLLQWYNRPEDSYGYYAAQFEKVYGISLDKEWIKWIQWEHRFQQFNLAAIRKDSITSYRLITTQTLGSMSRAFYDSEKNAIYTAVRYPGQVAHLVRFDLKGGHTEEICTIKGAALFYVSSLAYDPKAASIFYTTDNNGWRDLNVVNLTSGKSKRLIKDARVGDLAFNQQDRSLWGVRHYNGISSLVRIEYPYQEWDRIHSFPYGKDLFDIDISPDGSIITSALTEIGGKQQLIKMNIDELLHDSSSYDIVFDFEDSTPANFVFSQDGKYLYGSSYYSGVSNIYRYNFQYGEMEILTNCETGFFRPMPVSNDSLVVLRFTAEGFNPVIIPVQKPEPVSAVKFLGTEIAEKYPVVRSWNLTSPALINIDSLTVAKADYNTISNMHLDSAIPIVSGYKDYVTFGARLDFSDLLRLSGFDISFSYSPNTQLSNRERIHAVLNFHHWNWKISASYNIDDFYDLFGPTKTSRKGYALGIQYKKTLLYDEPKALNLTLDLTGHGGLERLPAYQNVIATYEELVSAQIGLNYKYIRRSLGAVDEEMGFKWLLSGLDNYVNSQHIFSAYTNFDYGFLLPINHSSIWLRTSLGYSFGAPKDPFANFFFGGFGNNWIDHLSEKRYRESYSFPGVDINAFGGKNYAKVLLEWNLPPIRFRRFGISSLYCNWARTAFFGSLMQLNFDRAGGGEPIAQFGFERLVGNLGLQVDFRMVLFSHLSSTFSIGYAVAFEDTKKNNNEFMISLKIM
jgi:hypothetical protein